MGSQAITSTVTSTGGSTQIDLAVSAAEVKAGDETFYEYFVPEFSCYVFFTKAEIDHIRKIDEQFKDTIKEYADALNEHRTSNYDGSKTALVEEKKTKLFELMKKEGVQIGDPETLDFITCFNVDLGGKAEEVRGDEKQFAAKLEPEHVLLVPIKILEGGQLPAKRTVDVSGFWKMLSADGTMDVQEKSTSVPAPKLSHKQAAATGSDGKLVPGETAPAFAISKESSVSGQLSVTVLAAGVNPALAAYLETTGFADKIDKGITALNQKMNFQRDSREDDRRAIVELFGPDNPEENELNLLMTHESWSRISIKCEELWKDESPVKNHWPSGLSRLDNAATPPAAGGMASVAPPTGGMATAGEGIQEKTWQELKNIVKFANLPPIIWDVTADASFLRYMGTASGQLDFNPLDGNIALSGGVSARAALAEGKVKGAFKLPTANGFDASVKFKARSIKYKTKIVHVFSTVQDYKGLDAFGRSRARIEKRQGTYRLILDGQIQFASDSAQLNTDSKLLIKDIVNELRRYPDLAITVHGHTDDTGQTDYNEQLSADRSNSTLTEFINNGIAPHRVNFRASGERSPVATNATEAGKAQNRRVEITIDQSGSEVFGLFSNEFTDGFNKFLDTSGLSSINDTGYEPPIFKPFSPELSLEGIAILKAMYQDVLEKADQLEKQGGVAFKAASGDSVTAKPLLLNHSNKTMNLAMTLKTIHGEEAYLPSSNQKSLKKLRYRVIHALFTGNIDFPSRTQQSSTNDDITKVGQSVLQHYGDFNLQFRDAFVRKMAEIDAVHDYQSLITKADTSAAAAATLTLSAPPVHLQNFFANALPPKASAVADATYHMDKNIGTQLCISIVHRSSDGFTDHKEDKEFEFGYLRLDLEGTLSAAACAKASLSGGVHINTGTALKAPGEPDLTEGALQGDDVRTDTADDEDFQGHLTRRNNAREKELVMSVAAPVTEADSGRPSAGAKVGGEVFVGVEASVGVMGKLLWHKPLKDETKEFISEGNFKELGSVGFIATASAGLGAGFELKVGFDQGSGKFIIRFKAKLVVKVGGGGEIVSAVDVTQLYNFFNVLYNQLRDAEFRIADIFENEDVYKYYCAAVWGVLTFGRYELIAGAVLASQKMPWLNTAIDYANQSFVSSAMFTVDTIQTWFDKWGLAKDVNLLDQIMERCSDKHKSLIESAPPEVIGNWLWFLLDATEWHDFWDQAGRRRALLYLLTKGISTRRELHEVLEHCLETPHASSGRDSESKAVRALDAADDILNRLHYAEYAKPLKEWFESLNGEFNDETIPNKDWLSTFLTTYY